MKFFNVTNTAKFLDTLRACEGPVYLVASSGERVDAKRFAAQAAGLRVSLAEAGDDGIEVIAERHADSTRLFRFMAEAARGAA